MKLCECRHWLAGQAVSHSAWPDSAGSPVHSYWPCMTLWPISMLSRIFETDSKAVPGSQAREEHQQGAAGDLHAALRLITRRM